jgi:hypothetical protein
VSTNCVKLDNLYNKMKFIFKIRYLIWKN